MARTAVRRIPPATTGPPPVTVSRPMRSASRSGPIGCPQPSTMPVSMSSAEADPDSSIRMAASRYGMSSALTTKALPVRAPDGRLAERGRDERLRAPAGFLAGQQARNQLDQVEHRNRVEEMDADDLRGPAGRHGQSHDRDGGCVGRQDGFTAGQDRVQGGEHAGLGLGVFRDGLDDEFAVREFGEVGGEPDGAQRFVPVGMGELSRLNRPVQRTGHAVPACSRRLGVDLGHQHVHAGPGRRLQRCRRP